jgi:hypothetical protein
MCCQCDENELVVDKNKTVLVRMRYLITCSRNSPFLCSPLFIIVSRIVRQCPVLRQMRDAHVLESYLFKLLSSIIRPPTSRCSRNELPSCFPTEFVSRHFTSTCQNPPICGTTAQLGHRLRLLHHVQLDTHTHTPGRTPLNE